MQLKNKNLLQTKAYINGKWVSADKTFEVSNPATGEKIADVADLSIEQVQTAIKQAETAFQSWSQKTAKERAVIMRKWYDLIMQNQDDLALLMTSEQGKPLKESSGEIAYAASFIEWFAEEGKRAYGDIIPTHTKDARIVVTKQPVGVCASITPWNFPSAMITRKVGPALAAGCSILCRPATQTPLSALALAVLAEEAGVPKGVFNVLTSTDSSGVGQEFCGNPIIKKLSFTGSTGVGKTLMKQSAETLQKLSLELGGNAPFIVFDDADIDAAVEGAIACKYRNAGQTCVCA
ncbi:MAG: aldehyde dehydrogenase family protein, partial [Alphaproteobacteria bacterium]